MAEQWKTVKLGDVCVLDKQSFDGSPLPYIGMEDVDGGGTGRFFGSHEAQTVKSNTFQFGYQHLLYGRLRPYLNKVLLPDFEGHCSTEIFPILCKDELDKRFLFYWLTSASVVEKINKTCTGARMPRANFKEVLKFNFRLPPLEEQKRIVAILDEAFEGIEKAQANAEQNLANARELFESQINALFSYERDGWITQKLHEAVSSVSTGPFGSMLHKSDYIQGGIPIVNPINIIDNEINSADNKTVSQKTAERLSTYRLAPDDIVIGRRGEIGRCAVVQADQDGWVCGTGCFYIKPSKALNPYFLSLLLRSSKYRMELERLATGATMKNLSNNSLKNLVISFPQNVEEQEEYVIKIDELWAKTVGLASIYEQKLKDLAELKQSLLQKAFSGELTKTPSASNVIAFPQLSPDEAHIGTIAYGYRKHEGTDHFNTYLRTKSEKIVHLIEYQTGIDMGRTAVPMARGPYDPDTRERVETKAKASNYFETYDNGRGIAIRRLENFDDIAKQAEAFYGDKKAEVDRILDLFLPLNHEEAEVRATVYAAWNNLLIDGEDITDEKIVTAAREDWHIEKQNIARPKFFNAIRWLEKNNLVPQGQGKRVGDKRLL